ncbi:hypothetical protein [Micromonospora sp. SH-82]|uniref:hypothetical protein n=1 Tax=Micromonospora sp. SH-82 TaxID=3132938 RepID=UPI003EB7B5F4
MPHLGAPRPAPARAYGPPTPLRPGDVFLLTSTASPQFHRPITIRIIRQWDRPTYHGWTWVDCYQLDHRGEATTRRELFLRPDGLVRPPSTPVGRS